MSGVPILTLILLAPLLGALLIAFLPRHRHDLIRYVALAVALLAFVLSLALLASFDPAATGVGGFTFVESVPWIPAFGIEYTVGIDGISLVLVVLTTLLTWISILASFRPITERVKEYMIAFLILEVGMLGVFMALDLFLFYVFWEIVLVPMYLIIGIWGGAQPHLRDPQVRALHAHRLAAHAGRHPGHGLRLPGRRRAAGRAPSTT